MIPSNITIDHIGQAAGRIDREGVPIRREARKYEVIVNNNRYPLKLIVSWANEFANGHELDPMVFGAKETKHFLLGLGFQVITIEDGLPVDR